MSSREVLLDVTRFLDSPQALRLGSLPRGEIRRLTIAFLECCYRDLGKSPRFLEEEDVRTIFASALPARLPTKDPAADVFPAVLDAYLDHLEETEVVMHAFEVRRGVDAALPACIDLVRSGRNTARADTGPSTPVVHRVPKLGRNDPCFCGSGRKFKKCHGKPG